jgi:hypothetical protein
MRSPRRLGRQAPSSPAGRGPGSGRDGGVRRGQCEMCSGLGDVHLGYCVWRCGGACTAAPIGPPRPGSPPPLVLIIKTPVPGGIANTKKARCLCRKIRPLVDYAAVAARAGFQFPWPGGPQCDRRSRRQRAGEATLCALVCFRHFAPRRRPKRSTPSLHLRAIGEESPSPFPVPCPIRRPALPHIASWAPSRVMCIACYCTG